MRPLQPGNIVSVEALQGGVTAHTQGAANAEREHATLPDGTLTHPTPRFAEAVAYLEIDRLKELTNDSPEGVIRWSRGFKVDPHPTDRGTIEWELEGDAPQIVQVGLEVGSQFQHTYSDIRLRVTQSKGKGKLTFATRNTVGGEEKIEEFVFDIAGILIIVRRLG